MSAGCMLWCIILILFGLTLVGGCATELQHALAVTP